MTEHGLIAGHGPVAAGEAQQYDRLLENVRASLSEALATGKHLFQTDASGLYDLILQALPGERAQHYNCQACRAFVDRFGGLVTIDDSGMIATCLWQEAPPFFEAAIANVRRAVHTANVVAPLYHAPGELGTPSTRVKNRDVVWTHLSANVTRGACTPRATQTNTQAAAEKIEDFGMLSRALADYGIDVATQAASFLKSGNLYRSVACQGVADWFLALHEKLADVRHEKARDNLVWAAVASAPAGWAHVRSGMIGTLLEDIKGGLPFHAIKERFDAKMNPLQYQRPQAAPRAGAIAEAERLVETLGLARSLERRFARLEDCELLWSPASTPPKCGGVFANVVPRGESAAPPAPSQPCVTMTWEKFARTILPGATSIRAHILGSGPFSALVTGARDDAPPIVQWDRVEKRNPVTWYTYSGGSTASDWGLRPGLVPVTGITLLPSSWGGAHTNQGDGFFVLLEGARDARKLVAGGSAGGGLFPEHVRSELHGIRSVVEAHTRQTAIAEADRATACGLMFRASGSWGECRLRVTSGGVTMDYKVDRWD